MNQQMQNTVIYGSTAANPERFTGLAERFNTLNTATAASAGNVVDAGGATATNTSMWLIGWGQNTVHGIFPKGGNAGLQVGTGGPGIWAGGEGGWNGVRRRPGSKRAARFLVDRRGIALVALEQLVDIARVGPGKLVPRVHNLSTVSGCRESSSAHSCMDSYSPPHV